VLLVTVVAFVVSACSAAAPRAFGGGGPGGVTSSTWTTFDQNSQRTGVDASGTSFSPASPAWTSPTLDGQLFGQPLVATSRVYAATENDTVYALAADTGAVLWSTHVGTPFDPSTFPGGICGNIGPTVGITSTPVIDAARDEIFVVAAEQNGTEASHHLVALDLYTGAIRLDEVIDPASVASPAHELQRTSLALTDGRVIVGFGGNAGDCDPYHGLVVSAPEDGSPPSVFVVATQPGDSQGAVWMGGSAPPVDAQGDVWVATGNSADTASADSDNSDSVLRLSPTAQLLDSFTPTTWHTDNGTDADLGSTSPALLANGLVFEVGKSRTAYVLHQSGLGGIGGQVAETPNFCSQVADGGSADLDGTLFVPCSDGLRAVRPTASAPTALWQTTSGAHGSPIVAGDLVWSVSGGTLYALDPATGATVQHFGIGSSPSSFPSPSAADGLVVAPSTDQLHAFTGPAGLPGPPDPRPVSPGYWEVASDGGVFSFGSAAFAGSAGSLALTRPVVGMASTPDHAGYWLVASDGGVFAFGDAGFYGSTGALHLRAPIVGMAATPDGRGYWLVASDGGVFAFGDAVFAGSTGGQHLNAGVVGMAAGPDDAGYWLVASDGGIFAFGSAPFEGSAGALRLVRPVVGMASTPAPGGAGYWLVASDGGIFAYGSVSFHGSMGAQPLTRPVVGMDASATGDGYWLAASDGGIFAFGDAGFEGSTGGSPLNAPVVGLAAGPTP
jgi:outer membrane protein assembly factor BamB